MKRESIPSAAALAASAGRVVAGLTSLASGGRADKQIGREYFDAG